MNVRIIDPRRPSAAKPRGWGREAIPEDFGDLEDPDEVPEATQVPRRDDRLDLLLDLRGRQLDLLSGCVSGAGAERLSSSASSCFAERVEILRASVLELEKTGREFGLEVPASSASPTERTLQSLPATPGRHFSSGPEMIGAALFLNSLSVTLVEAFLGEADAAAWRTVLVPLLADDCRFEGRLKGYLEEAGDRAVALGEERIARAAGVKSADPQRLWSFDLLRMGIRRLLGEGQAASPGGSVAAD